jgi:hypothetical protein
MSWRESLNKLPHRTIRFIGLGKLIFNECVVLIKSLHDEASKSLL